MSIRVECPSCGKGIKAPDKYAGKKAKCPGCGGNIAIPERAKPPAVRIPPEILPASIACPFCAEPIQPQARKCKHCGEFLNEEDRPVKPTSQAPVAPAAIMQQAAPVQSAKEQDLLKVRPKVFRNNPVGIVFLWIFLFVGIGIAMANGNPGFWAIPALVALALTQKYLAGFTTLLTITNRRTILRHGILSKHTREVRHVDVRLLEVSQSFFQRFMSVGAIAVASAGQGEVEIRVSGILKPAHVKETIDGYRP